MGRGADVNSANAKAIGKTGFSYTLNRALHTLKIAIYTLKRALHILKRALKSPIHTLQEEYAGHCQHGSLYTSILFHLILIISLTTQRKRQQRKSAAHWQKQNRFRLASIFFFLLSLLLSPNRNSADVNSANPSYAH